MITDPIEELRAIETHERLRSESRVTFVPAAGTPAEQLWREGSFEGAAACGFDDVGGEIEISRDDPTLALVESDDALLDAIVFSGAGSMVRAIHRA